MDQFTVDDLSGSQQLVNFETPGLIINLDTLGIVPRLVPADSIGLFNAQVMQGHDIGFSVLALQSNGSAFNLTGLSINFYGRVLPSDSTKLFNKTSQGNPTDVIISNPAGGVIQTYVRAADTATVSVNTTIYLYVDIINALGNPVNIVRWTLTIIY